MVECRHYWLHVLPYHAAEEAHLRERGGERGERAGLLPALPVDQLSPGRCVAFEVVVWQLAGGQGFGWRSVLGADGREGTPHPGEVQRGRSPPDPFPVDQDDL